MTSVSHFLLMPSPDEDPVGIRLEAMSSTSNGGKLLSKLLPSARQHLQQIVESHRQTLWGDTQLKLRVRKYPKAGGGERISLVRPQLQLVKLYSHVLGRQVPLTITPEMLRSVEAKGGLDQYLLTTPDKLLHSDIASNLKWEMTCKMRRASQDHVKMDPRS